MSKTKLVITAVVVQNRPVAQVAAEYGVSRSWLYELLARYRAEGDAVFEPRSRRPQAHPERDTGRGRGADSRAPREAHHHRTGRRPRDDLLAPGPSPRGPDRPDHDLPTPTSPRPGRPGAEETPQVLLHSLRRRTAQRTLAIGLHPLPTHPPRRPAPAQTARSCPGSTTAPGSRCGSPLTPGSPARSCQPSSAQPSPHTGSRPPR